MAAHEELEEAYEAARHDPAFNEELADLGRHYVGRPTPLYLAERLTAEVGGARLWLKREDLAHTGAHKINNALGQSLLAKRLGKPRIIAETGAGQHGVATATVCAKLGLECVVYMGTEDIRRQSLNVFRMKMLGAEVVPVDSGSRTLKDAINEAMRDWVTNVRTTHYLIGSAIGPHPFRRWCGTSSRSSGGRRERRCSSRRGGCRTWRSPAWAAGAQRHRAVHPFLDDPVRLVGVEAAGEGLTAPGRNAARWSREAGGAARNAHLPAAGTKQARSSIRTASRRARLPRRGSRALVAEGERTRGVHRGGRCGGADGVPAAYAAARGSSRRWSRRTPSSQPSASRKRSARAVTCSSG